MWAVVDLLGHVRLAGWLTEEEKFGSKLGRLEMPMPDGSTMTRWFGGGSVYSVSAVTEDVVRALAMSNPPPVSPYDVRALVQAVLPPPSREPREPRDEEDDEFDDDDEDHEPPF